jgi:hypothetical protein
MIYVSNLPWLLKNPDAVAIAWGQVLRVAKVDDKGIPQTLVAFGYTSGIPITVYHLCDWEPVTHT